MADEINNCVSASMSIEEVNRFKLEMCRGRSYWPRMSLNICVQISGLVQSSGHYFEVLDQIDSLEGVGRPSFTKDAQQFRRKPLRPLFHKHFFTAVHMAENLNVRWNLDRDGNRDLHRMLTGLADSCGDQPDVWQARLAHDFVVGGFEDRARGRRLTGDWIIYAVHKEERYYLGLSKHTRSAQEEQDLHDGLRRACEWEYPFAFQDIE